MKETTILTISAFTTAVVDRYFGWPGMREYLIESIWHAFCTASVHSTARRMLRGLMGRMSRGAVLRTECDGTVDDRMSVDSAPMNQHASSGSRATRATLRLLWYMN